jgi:O-antigen/teichoic acid export membrane protein
MRFAPGFVGFGALVTMPGVCALAWGGRPLVLAIFGNAYPDATTPLVLIGLGMAMHGLYLVFFSIWVGLGRPLIDLVATAAGMTTTVAVAFFLIPFGGLAGAAIAFAFGAGVRLGVISAFTAWSLYLRPSRPMSGTVTALVPETPMVAAAQGGRDSIRLDGDAANA